MKRWSQTPLFLLALASCTSSSGGGQTPSCTPGENRCFGNNLGTCASDGATWTLGFCGTEKTCFDGQCAIQVCTPGSTSCADEWTALVCEDGLRETPAPCALGEKCYGAGCLPITCTPGEMRCLHDTRLTCANPGWVGVPCPEGQACKDDQCVPKICTPREGVCIAHPNVPGAQIGLTCNLNGTQWASQNPCSPDQVCKEGFCFPKTPAPLAPDAGPEDTGLDPGHADPGPTAEDLSPPQDTGPEDSGPSPDLPPPPPDPNRAIINGTPVPFSDFVKASILAGGQLMVALHSPPMDGVPFPDVLGRKQIVEIHFPGITVGQTGTFRCEDDTVRIWYRFGKYLQGGECKDYDYVAKSCVVTLAHFQADVSLVAGTFDAATLEDCLPGGGAPVTIVDGHFHYEK